MVLPKLYLILLSIKAEQEEIVSDLLWKKILLPTLTYKDFLLWGHLTYPGRGTSIKEVRCQYPKIWILFPFWAYIAFSIWIEHLTSVNLKVLKFKDEHLFSDPEFCHSGPDNSSFWRLPVYPREVTAASVWDAFNTLTFRFLKVRLVPDILFQMTQKKKLEINIYKPDNLQLLLVSTI